MTYEPGQQVLVPAVIEAPLRKDGYYWVTVPTCCGEPFLTAAADVVGPAPATPHEGGETIRAISDDMYTFRAQRDEARAALAAAEARIAAVVALDAEEYTYNGLIAVEDLRRALSVEADE